MLTDKAKQGYRKEAQKIMAGKTLAELTLKEITDRLSELRELAQ